MLLIDLVVELTDRLRLFNYPTYRKQLYAMLTDLVAYHRPTLRGDVASLAEHTLELLTPGATPDLAAAELADQRWTEILDEFGVCLDGTAPERQYNARTCCWMLRLVHAELSDSRYAMAEYVGAALVGWQIRPRTPNEIDQPDRLDTAMTDPDIPEVQTLMGFIASARSALSVRTVR